METILKHLKNARVFKIRQVTQFGVDYFEFEECCDNAFCVMLNKEQMIQLINELKSLIGVC